MKKIILASAVAAALCSTFALAACDGGKKEQSPVGTHTYKVTTAEGFDRLFDTETVTQYDGRFYFPLTTLSTTGGITENIGTRSESTIYVLPKLDVASIYEGTVTFSATFTPESPEDTSTRDAAVLVDRTVEIGNIGYMGVGSSNVAKHVGSQKLVVDNSASSKTDKSYDENLSFNGIEYTVKSCDITVTIQNDNAIGISGYEAITFKLDMANFSNYLNVMTMVHGPTLYEEGEEGYDATHPYKYYWQKVIATRPVYEDTEFREVTLKFDDGTTVDLAVSGEYTTYIDEVEKLDADPGKAPLLAEITGEVVLYPGTEAYLTYWTLVHTYREIVDGR